MFRKIVNFFNNFLERIVVFWMALLFCQFPQLFLQYMDALVGAHYEALRNLRLLEEKAQTSGKNLNQYIEKHLKSPDQDFRSTGEYMESLVKREIFYREALGKLRDAPPYLRWWYFLVYLERDLLKQIDFRPALPLTLEALLYAFVGILVGMGIYRLISAVIFLLLSPIRRVREVS